MAGTIQISRQVPELVAESDSSQAANQSAQSDLWIFREGRREVSGPQTVRSLQERIDSGNDLLDCLIEAGQLEAALADLNDPGTSAAASLTDALASDTSDMQLQKRRKNWPDDFRRPRLFLSLRLRVLVITRCILLTMLVQSIDYQSDHPPIL